MACNPSCQKEIIGMADGLAGAFTVITWGISLLQVIKHLKHYTNPYFQNKILVIIFMAPFYALTSFLTIYTQDSVGYFALVRDIYESILIYAFFNLLSLYLAFDPETKTVDNRRIYEQLATKGVRQHMWPMNHVWSPLILISETRAKWFYKKAELNILQYLAIKPAATFLLGIVYLINEESNFVIFLKFVVFISVMLSVYYLVLFYQLLKEELAFARPLLKFIAVKGVLFFTFWQDFVIEIFKKQIMSQFTDLRYEEKFIIAVCQNILVCFEMVILSIVTTVAFSYQDFREAERIGPSFLKKDGIKHLTEKLLQNVIVENVSEAFQDLKELKEPLKDPFKSYRDANIERGEIMTIAAKQEKGLITEEIHKQVRITVHEMPLIVPNFINKHEETKDGDSEDEFRYH